MISYAFEPPEVALETRSVLRVAKAQPNLSPSEQVIRNIRDDGA
jgi:hypothetical protein